ncbi:hypothetical protein KPA93_20485 [Burkholderia cenocepacia]|uniref:hypothetical protein n=1 Tax=Burkholderia cepacia complex TaxID=87882 RepID=UPI000F55D353|nr:MULTISPECIES: hypothetical protein [Burkholderia cepacia complex]ELK7722629.1 hypothetical protein [Burkholderia cenocepacia]MBK1823934.1 hypothetical protein [Burkholderia orbicola]MBR8307613.1 hypothetical protein [Burkholderia cenocepacia]MDR8025626.1 hypothetical protein [Burkholderia cenocepacia]MDR8042866.1 hypothetical protein [Burkholderia cenocepacia]
MNKIINFSYIGPLYYYLYSMTDDELDDFYINDESDLSRLFEEMKLRFERFGPISRSRVLDVLEYVLASHSWEANWRGLLPQEIPLDEVKDKKRFVHDLFVVLAGREPNSDFDVRDVEVNNYVGPDGVDTKM